MADQRVSIIITITAKERSRLCGCILQVCYCLFCKPKIYIKENLAYVPDKTENRKNILRARAKKGQLLLKDGYSIEQVRKMIEEDVSEEIKEINNCKQVIN